MPLGDSIFNIRQTPHGKQNKHLRHEWLCFLRTMLQYKNHFLTTFLGKCSIFHFLNRTTFPYIFFMLFHLFGHQAAQKVWVCSQSHSWQTKDTFNIYKDIQEAQSVFWLYCRVWSVAYYGEVERFSMQQKACHAEGIFESHWHSHELLNSPQVMTLRDIHTQRYTHTCTPSLRKIWYETKCCMNSPPPVSHPRAVSLMTLEWQANWTALDHKL